MVQVGLSDLGSEILNFKFYPSKLYYVTLSQAKVLKKLIQTFKNSTDFEAVVLRLRTTMNILLLTSSSGRAFWHSSELIATSVSFST